MKKIIFILFLLPTLSYSQYNEKYKEFNFGVILIDPFYSNLVDGLGVQFLDIYIEGSYVGTLLGNLGFSFIPPCDPPDSDAVNFSIEWQNNTANPNTTFSWQVRDGSDGFIYYDGTDLVSANDCLTLGLSAKKIQEYLNSK